MRCQASLGLAFVLHQKVQREHSVAQVLTAKTLLEPVVQAAQVNPYVTLKIIEDQLFVLRQLPTGMVIEVSTTFTINKKLKK